MIGSSPNPCGGPDEPAPAQSRRERHTPAGGPDFPGETFRVLKEKETAKFGEYRTRRLVLEAWDRLSDLDGPATQRTIN